MSKNRHGLRVVHSNSDAFSTNRKGKIVHDARGNAVWQWAGDAAELDSVTTTGLLRSLSGSVPLALEPEASGAPGDRGFDPYNRRRS